MKFWRIALAGLLACGGLVAAEPNKNGPLLTVDLRAHRGEIRAALLQRTPLGANLKDVSNFIAKGLQTGEGSPPLTVEPVKDKSHPNATRRLRVFLGQYYDHPEVVFFSAPLLMQREVTGEWFFDSSDRLVDLVVEKKDALY